MRGAYDQFNLMELPSSSKQSANFKFNEHDFMRKVPKGIFPDAKRPRVVLRPPGTELESNGAALNSQLDPMTQFERSPMQAMIKTELVKNMHLANKPVS